MMKWFLSLPVSILVVGAALAQGLPGGTTRPSADLVVADSPIQAHREQAKTTGNLFAGTEGTQDAFLAGNHNFDNFIGYLSNPIQNIDPRAMTALLPMTGGAWISTLPALPSGNIQIPPGAGITVALSERLSVGINQGGYAIAYFNREPGRFSDHLGRLRDRRDFSGQRDGWLDLGGFFQYTLIQDVPNQFLLTAGLRWVAPIGSKAVFQGIGPAQLAPYATVGKELGKFHVLATGGYQFLAQSGDVSRDTFYLNVHVDRQCFGWLYPLVEFNASYHTTRVDIDAVTRGDFINFGNFESTGNIVNMAVGANAVLIKNKLEVGGVYTTAIASQRNFNMNGYLLKMVLRY